MYNIRRGVKVFLLRSLKKISIFTGEKSERMTSQDRKIKRVVKKFINKKTTKVYYSPNNLTFYIYSQDRKVVIVFNSFYIRITNHKFFFNSYLHDNVFKELESLCRSKIEEEFKKTEKEISYNEENFLDDLYDNFSKEKVKDDKTRSKYSIGLILESATS
jgi:hypothetical protein